MLILINSLQKSTQVHLDLEVLIHLQVVILVDSLVVEEVLEEEVQVATGKKTIIFDLDGTLIDSLEDIAVCMNQVLEELNLPIHKMNDYKYFVGGGISVLVENSLNALNKEIGEELKQKVTQRFKEIYDQKLHAKTKPYEGIYELLDELTKLDCNIGILSNKPMNLPLLMQIVYFQNILFHKFTDKNLMSLKNQTQLQQLQLQIVLTLLVKKLIS